MRTALTLPITITYSTYLWMWHIVGLQWPLYKFNWVWPNLTVQKTNHWTASIPIARFWGSPIMPQSPMFKYVVEISGWVGPHPSLYTVGTQQMCKLPRKAHDKGIWFSLHTDENSVTHSECHGLEMVPLCPSEAYMLPLSPQCGLKRW